MNENIRQNNVRLLSLLSHYLNTRADWIKSEEINSLCAVGLSDEYAVAALAAAACGLDAENTPEDKQFFRECFLPAFHKLQPDDYLPNPYLKTIRTVPVRNGNIAWTLNQYRPFECFVFNDIIREKNGYWRPQIGFFAQDFIYPALLENGRIWMTVTPNEIETMKAPIQAAHGHVLTYGLGLGYFIFMTALKPEVQSVTAVEKNPQVIDLFRQHILPQFPCRSKIQIIQADAFEYADKQLPKENIDFVFTDLWHDVSDGLPLYLRMKELEPKKPTAQFAYWIEQTLRCYL